MKNIIYILILILVIILGYCTCFKKPKSHSYIRFERFSGDINDNDYINQVILNIKWSFDNKKKTKDLYELDSKISLINYVKLRRKYIDNELNLTPEDVRNILN